MFIRIVSAHHYFIENRADIPKLSIFASWPPAMFNPQWLELPMSRTNFHGSKDVRTIEVRPYYAGRYGKEHVQTCSAFSVDTNLWVLMCCIWTI